MLKGLRYVCMNMWVLTTGHVMVGGTPGCVMVGGTP